MTMTRRALLAAVGAAIARGQQSRDRLQIVSKSGLRLEQHGDAQLPAIAVFLPSTAAPAAVIEMPEHAWRRAPGANGQSWFYKMYGADASQRGKVSWKFDGRYASVPNGHSVGNPVEGQRGARQ
jgi:hypothetical protein